MWEHSFWSVSWKKTIWGFGWIGWCRISTETYPTCVGLISHFLWGEKFPFLKYTGSSQHASLELHFSIGGTAAVSNSYWYVVCFADFQGIAMQLFGTGIMKWDPFSGGDQMYGTVCELVGSFWKISPRTSALFGYIMTTVELKWIYRYSTRWAPISYWGTLTTPLIGVK